MRISGQKPRAADAEKHLDATKRKQNCPATNFLIWNCHIGNPVSDLSFRFANSGLSLEKNLRVGDTYAAPDIIENRPTLRNPEYRFPLRVVIFPRRRFSPRRPPATSAAAVFARHPPLPPQKIGERQIRIAIKPRTEDKKRERVIARSLKISKQVRFSSPREGIPSCTRRAT